MNSGITNGMKTRVPATSLIKHKLAVFNLKLAVSLSQEANTTLNLEFNITLF